MVTKKWARREERQVHPAVPLPESMDNEPEKGGGGWQAVPRWATVRRPLRRHKPCCRVEPGDKKPTVEEEPSHRRAETRCLSTVAASWRRSVGGGARRREEPERGRKAGQSSGTDYRRRGGENGSAMERFQTPFIGCLKTGGLQAHDEAAPPKYAGAVHRAPHPSATQERLLMTELNEALV
ncbi:hypothetical protein SKAU_G00130230 [Synaphobranchus kaupii]|uniref:Uncharacterized protein n=1 Tax=Synaphobranchus kaupii TaxID=118154 RepID=A0A9Q1FQD3_SYNKA|nr:hypothetical protein SKAU_G00130230 [Synaphobranchus kaupii]